MKVAEALFVVLGAIGMLLLFSLLLSYPLMLLWNWCLVPAVPALHEVGWLQMWGISILVSSMCKANITKKS